MKTKINASNIDILYRLVASLGSIRRVPFRNLLIHNMLTCPCNVDPLTPNFYIVKLGCTGVCIIFLFLRLYIDCGYSLEPPQ